jgi:thioredoxin 1
MDSPNIPEITSDQFVDRIVVPQADALVKVSAAWSGAGQMLGHTLNELSQKYADKLSFFSVDQESNSDFIAQYRVDATPTLLFFKKGTLVDKLAGLNHRNAIEAKINQIVNA